jgi:hypothetical protein
MKKLFLSGLLALGATLVSQQSAQAWVNFKFSAGVNAHLQSGNNCLLWGLFKDGPGGPDCFNGHPGGLQGYPGPHGPHGPYGPGPGPGYGHDFPFFGSATPVPAAPPAGPTAPTSTPAQQTYWQGGNPYHTTGYNPGAYPYPTVNPGYYYPANYGHYYAPSYWYR